MHARAKDCDTHANVTFQYWQGGMTSMLEYADTLRTRSNIQAAASTYLRRVAHRKTSSSMYLYRSSTTNKPIALFD